MKNIKTISVSIVAIFAMSGCAAQNGYNTANNGIVGQQTINNAVMGATTAVATGLLTGGNSNDIIRNAAVGAAVGVVGGVVAGQLPQQ